jgi:hypothetical protein
MWVARIIPSLLSALTLNVELVQFRLLDSFLLVDLKVIIFSVYALGVFVSVSCFGQDPKSLNAYKYAWTPLSKPDLAAKEPWKTFMMLMRNRHIGLVGNMEDGGPEINEAIAENYCLMAGWTISVAKSRSDRWQIHFYVKDCNGDVVYKSREVVIKADFEYGWRDAIIECFSELNNTTYAFDFDLHKARYIPQVDTVEINEEAFLKYLRTNSNKIDPMEGIYVSTRGKQYRVGIKKDGYKFKGVIFDSNTEYWKEGEIKFSLEKIDMTNLYTGTFFDLLKRRVSCTAELDNFILRFKLRNDDESTRDLEFHRMATQ